MKRYIRTSTSTKHKMNEEQKKGYNDAKYYAQKYRKAMKVLAK